MIPNSDVEGTTAKSSDPGRRQQPTVVSPIQVSFSSFLFQFDTLMSLLQRFRKRTPSTSERSPMSKL